MVHRNEHQHVVPHNEGWAIQRTQASKPYRVFRTKDEAMRRAQSLARQQHTVLVVHGRDGKIQEQRNYT